MDTLSQGDEMSEERKAFKKKDNPADCFPLILHGSYKIMSNIEYILKYLQNTYPDIKSELFDNIQGNNFEKLIKWHQNILKPRCDSLI